jgi:hypothetical protein
MSDDTKITESAPEESVDGATDWEYEDPAEFWPRAVAQTRAGDWDYTDVMFANLAHFLEGERLNNAVHLSPEVRAFLAERIWAALGAPKHKVGDAMGLGKGSKGSRKTKYDDFKRQFLGWYWQQLKARDLDHQGLLPPKEVRDWIDSNLPEDLENIRDATFGDWLKDARRNWRWVKVIAAAKDVPVPQKRHSD